MSQNPTKTEDTIDLKELFFSLIAQWKIIALYIILSLICALLYLRVTPNTYSVDALVQVETQKGASAALLGQELSNIMGSSGLGGQQVAQAEIEILKSRLVLGTTIQDLNLDIQIQPKNNSLFKRLITPSEFETQYSRQGVIVKDQLIGFNIQQFDVPQSYLDKSLLLEFKDSSFSLTDLETDEVVAKGKLNQLNTISSVDGLWKIKIDAKDKINEPYILTKQAITTAVNGLLDNYAAVEKGKMTGVIGLNYQGTDKLHITQVLNVILQTYKQQNIERGTAEKEQTLKFLDKQLPELKQELDQAERQFNVFRQRYNTVDVTKESELYLTQSIQLETQKLELQQKQAELAAKYTEQHPMMQEINAQLGAVTKKINELNGTLKRLPDVQRQYLQYYRDVEVKQQLYTSLLNTYQTLNIAKAGEIGNVRIVDTAIEPVKPIKPRKLIVLILSIFMGGFIGVLVALARNMLRTGIKDSSQIENELELPVYATVPRSPIQENRLAVLKKKKNIPILAVKHSDDIAIESLRSIRTAIHFALSGAKNNIIMISGPAPEVGKSFISTNLATIFAQGDKRVLLIDADLRRGYLHKYFNMGTQPGLTELLTDQASSAQVIHSTEVANLNFMSRGKSPSNPSELLSSQKFQTLLQELSQQYDHIILDTPPVLAVTDGIIISQYTGVNLIVARHAKTQMKELELALNRFEQAGVKVNGFILNDIQRSASGSYGYNYAYAYKAAKDD
ncbi:polysaccharide biosynthesis tyrosine autokinase [Acinetobacter sp. S40]|uniref:polysaccharide biosynthesis tyrosine autokinase n=1 Tax=unclassified Acinetobacter TaxID=196816 RepID=UPI00190D5BC9|nr:MULTISPECIES: polysaccharide biosynthesis tyrosine autokinase [unclassified Acinetobacter]MBJ9986111.1 polysaccharide biosynthesis tyrosine autokinase [Acinetobacter sp. S40]MBK0064283.1 polysaccharide biosynthesis tyrosine autokinase [Acinetobacter sp. S55]MBK0067725.1 polysaccharide biosynthesis tyrosine autokinase [Acinetobacter sp. S54]